MDIIFLGVGEACDGNQPNTSMLLKTAPGETGGRILLDCGFSVPHRYFALDPQPEELEIVWISHFHGDHFMGMPLLLLWFWESNRTKPLTIAGPPGLQNVIETSMKLAYPNFLPRINFDLVYREILPGTKHEISGTAWQTAYNDHSQPCLSLRLETGKHSLFYSGDGRPTRETGVLARGCDLIVHEAYGLEDTVPGHGSIVSCLEFANSSGVRRLALVHLQRGIRPQAGPTLTDYRELFPDVEIMMPETGSTLQL